MHRPPRHSRDSQVSFLLEAGASAVMPDRRGWTPVMYADFGGRKVRPTAGPGLPSKQETTEVNRSHVIVKLSRTVVFREGARRVLFLGQSCVSVDIRLGALREEHGGTLDSPTGRYTHNSDTIVISKYSF